MSNSSVSVLPRFAPARAGAKRVFEIEQLSALGLRVEVPLGHVELTLGELLQLHPGSILSLNRLTGESLELTVNGTPVAKGEVRVHGERFAIRITGVLQSGRLDPIEGDEPSGKSNPRR